MAAGRKNFLCEQGATFNPKMTWRQKSVDPDVPGDPVNLTGYTARMQVRPTVQSSVVTIPLTTENDRIILGGAAGTIELYISDEDTALIKEGSYKYDLELQSSGGLVYRLLQGNFKVSPEVTR